MYERARACVYTVCTVPLLRPLEWKAAGERDTSGFCFLLCISPLSVCSARNFYHLPTQQLSLSLLIRLSTRMKILPRDARENTHKEERRKRIRDRPIFKSGIRCAARLTHRRTQAIVPRFSISFSSQRRDCRTEDRDRLIDDVERYCVSSFLLLLLFSVLFWFLFSFNTIIFNRWVCMASICTMTNVRDDS